jgi:uncharacterized protein
MAGMLTSNGQIDYERLVADATREAMRSVVREVITLVAADGLPGEHHFYISFDTNAPGVSLSKRLKERYPQEMTVVLQHRFWDLQVFPDRFEVKLAFNSIPERLVIPFAAIKVFVDPSVRFGHQFEDVDLSEAANPTGEGPEADEAAPAPRKRPARRRPTVAEAAPDAPRPAPVISAAKSTATAPAVSPAPVAASPSSPAAAEPGAKVVSLDQFRKK